MLVTEEDARELWCPFARQPMQPPPGEFVEAEPSIIIAGNRTTQGRPAWGCRCLASGCMAWRWWWWGRDDEHPPNRGYCGLAGAPHDENDR